MVGRALIRAALAAFLATSPAFAYVEGWPALYDVVNVAEDDVLNVRDDPDASSYKFGELKPGEVVEVIDSVKVGSRKWYKITPPSGEFRWIRSDELAMGDGLPEEASAEAEPLADAAPASGCW